MMPLFLTDRKLLLLLLLLLLLFLFSLLLVLLVGLYDLRDDGWVIQSRHVTEVTGFVHGNLPEDPPHDLPGASLRQPLHHLREKQEILTSDWLTGAELVVRDTLR